MSTDLKQNIGDVFREGTPIDRALEAATRAAIVRHKQSGQPMPVWRDGKTIITDNIVFQSVEDRDGMLQSGMESGQNESYERLDELLVRA